MNNQLGLFLSVLLVANLAQASGCRDIVRAPANPGTVNYEINRLKYQIDRMGTHILAKKYDDAKYELQDINVMLLELREELNVRSLFENYEKSFAIALNTMNDIRTILKGMSAEGLGIPPAVFKRYIKEYAAKIKIVRTEMKPVLDYAD